jgi:hypothetical protein
VFTTVLISFRVLLAKCLYGFHIFLKINIYYYLNFNFIFIVQRKYFHCDVSKNLAIISAVSSNTYTYIYIHARSEITLIFSFSGVKYVNHLPNLRLSLSLLLQSLQTYA